MAGNESFTVNGDTVNFSGFGGYSREVPIDILNQAVDYRVQNTQKLQNNLASDYWTPQEQRRIYDQLAAKGDVFGQTFEQWSAGQQGQRQAYENSIAKHSPLLNNPNLGQLNPTLTQELANDLPGFGGFRQDYDTAQANYLKEQQGTGKFSSFLKGAAPIAAIGLGALAAPAIAGAFGGTATGVAAGSGAGLSGGLGSSILAGFSTPQALTGALTGGLGGLASGGNLSSALKGAAFGGLGGGFGSSIGSSMGLGQVGQQAFTGALTGASGGLGSGNLKDAGLGALLGGAGGYLQGGGQIPGLGSFDQQLPPDVFGPAKQGTGLLGGAQDLFQTANTGLTIGGQPMKLGSLLSAGSDIYGYSQGRNDIDEISKLYQQAQNQASAQLNPYAQAGQTALQNLQAPSLEALQNDPGYQFRLQQGNQALERSLAAQGMGQSGAALKAAQEYGQGLADQTYNDYFNRQNQIANQGYNAASGLGSIIGQGAQGQAGAQLAQINNRNQALSNIFGGGYDDNGNILQGSLSRLLGGFF